MAERRCFTKKITESDAFLEMPVSSQCLYFHLNMAADDDGFVNAPKKIARMVGASDDDLKLLVAKSFVLAFETGVIVIKHWKMHNTLRNDRYHPTDYQEEFRMLGLKDNGSYTWQPNGNQMATKWQPNGNQLETELNITKHNITKYINNSRFAPPTLEDVSSYCSERRNDVDPQRFIDFYESKGWMVGKNKMKDWKAAIRTWESKDKKVDDTVPTYSTKNNKQLSNEELDELLALRGK